MSDELFKSSDFDKLKLTLAEHLNTVGLDDFAIKDLISDITVNAALLAQARYRELHPPVSEGMRFTAEDFIEYSHTSEGRCLKVLSTNKMAEKANAKLQRILAQGVRVWRTKLMNVSPGWIADSRLWCEVQSEATGEAGIVINIEEVKDA